jgi:hypothetical protein
VIRGVIYVLYFLVILFFVRLVTRSVGQLFGAGGSVRRSGDARRSSSGRAEDLVRDRICNTYVPRTRALAEVIEGREEHFCSEACRDKARASVPRAS